jgi:hypothetical protein
MIKYIENQRTAPSTRVLADCQGRDIERLSVVEMAAPEQGMAQPS